MISVRRDRRRAPASTLVLATATLVLVGVTLALAERRPPVDRERVELPATLTAAAVPPGAAVISIDGSGVIRVSTGVEPSAPVADADGVRRFVLAVVGRDAARTFAIRADRAARWDVVHRVASALREAGAARVVLLSRQRDLDEEL